MMQPSQEETVMLLPYSGGGELEEPSCSAFPDTAILAYCLVQILLSSAMYVLVRRNHTAAQ